MAKKFFGSSTPEVVAPVTSPKSEVLKTLLKARLPGVFDAEPSPAYAEGALNKLVADILAL